MNFEAMTLDELVKTFNEMVITAVDLDLLGFKVIKKFRDRNTGLQRCKTLHEAIQKKNGGGSTKRIRAGGIPNDAKISILVEENPKRGKAKERFDLYKEGMLVSTYKEKIGDPKQAIACLRWDAKKKFIKIVVP